MSTSWNAICLDHPNASPWLDDAWSSSGRQAALDLACLWRDRDVLMYVTDAAASARQLDVELEYAGYRKVSAGMIRWAREHDRCRLELVNEYGHRRDLESMQPLPPRHCPTCTCEPR